MKRTPIFIIDFDSTFVTVEALDELAKIALHTNPDKNELFDKIAAITKAGMEGEISFPESLRSRLKLFQADKKHIDKLIALLKRQITPSIHRNKDFFKLYADSIYILSGGFREYIEPVVKSFGILPDHILSNTFTLNKKGQITGFDEKNPLSTEGGKVTCVKKLNLGGQVLVIGDGYTDYQIRESGFADAFFAFTENAVRNTVIKKADYVVSDFDDVLYRLKLPRSRSFPKSRMKALLLENIHETAQKILEDEGYEVESIASALGERELIEKIKHVSLLGIRSKTKITSSVVRAAPKLLLVGAFCIGTNQIDLAACTNAGVAVFNAPYSNTRSVVELIIGEIIMLSRKIFDKSVDLHRGAWNKSAKNCHEIRGKTLGIVGYGNIGSQLSVVAENLGMKVIYYDIIDKLAYGNASRCRTLEELLKKADIVTIHVDGRKSNEDLIDEAEFSLMKPGSLFLNASRGFVVNADALAQHIKNGHLAGAAVDVFQNEPKSNSEPFESVLRNLPNVILTPHVGAGTEEAQENIANFVSERIRQFVDNGDTTLSVNMPHLQLPEMLRSHRFIHIHRNVAGILAKINSILAEHKINIEGQYLKTNESIGYVITDVYADYDTKVITKLREIPETIRVRVLY